MVSGGGGSAYFLVCFPATKTGAWVTILAATATHAPTLMAGRAMRGDAGSVQFKLTNLVTGHFGCVSRLSLVQVCAFGAELWSDPRSCRPCPTECQSGETQTTRPLQFRQNMAWGKADTVCFSWWTRSIGILWQGEGRARHNHQNFGTADFWCLVSEDYFRVPRSPFWR